MYSEKIIVANLEEFSRREGWCPVYHSEDEITEFVAYVDSIISSEIRGRNEGFDFKKKITERRAREIRRWVENEQVLCMFDSSYFETRYAWVCDHKAEVFKFKNRKAQELFDNIIAEFDEQQVSIELLILKARQQGVTTKVALKFLHRMLFLPHTQAVMGSVDEKKSELISRIIETCISRTPWWLRPTRTTDRIKMTGFINGSVLSVQSGNQATGIAQGWTPTCLVPSVPIRVADGRLLPICEISKGYTVITHQGSLVKVVTSFRTDRQPGPTKIIKVHGNYEALECTPDHRIWTSYGWREAGDLMPGDVILHPVRKISDSIKVFTVPHLPRGKVKESRIEQVILPVSPALGYLCGLYVAEGYCHKSAVGHVSKTPYYSELVFTVHRREAQRTVDAIRLVAGEKQHVRVKDHNENGSQVTVSSAWLTRWIAENFGTKLDKHVPDWVFHAGKDFCLYLLRGYMDGDGHCEKGSNLVIAPCICRSVVFQLRDLVASLGLGWASIYHLNEVRSKWGGRKREVWKLALVGPCGYAYRKLFGEPTQPSTGVARHWKYSDSNIEVMIETVTDGWSQSFYDIEVDNADHSFLTGQCAVHNCVHLSEIGDIPNPKKTIEEGLFPATHSSRKLFMVLEGTGNGNTGWQADKWRSAKEGWPLGRSRLFPLFIPWPLAPDLYPEPDFLRKFPVPNEFKPIEATRKHVQRCELYIRNTPALAKVCGAKWRMPIEQQWFWEFKYLESVSSHTQKIWFSQMPADDYEALQGSNDLVFDSIVVESAKEKRSRNYQAYAITGNSIDDGFDPVDSEIDNDKERIRVTWNSDRGQQFHWIMVPLLPFDEEDERRAMNKVLVFEEPNSMPGHTGDPQDYSIGIDTADGLGQDDEDRSVCSITRSMSGDGFDVQVAELCSNQINAPQMVGFSACLAAWYGQDTKDPRGCKFAIEQRERPGDDCQLQLKLMGFTYHHVDTRYDNKVVKENKGSKEGWYTNAWSRPMLMNRFVEAVRGGWYIPNSPFLIRELGSLERKVAKTGKSRLEHQAGKHDDRVLSAAMSYFTRHALDVMAERSQKRYALPSKKNPELDFGYANLGEVSVGEW